MTVDTLTRAVDLYRRTAASRSALVLVAANLIPLVGVLFFGWSLWTILVLYWVENGIVGFWNVPKILLAQGAVMPTVVPPIPDDAALAASGWDPVRAGKLRAEWEKARQAQQAALDAANAAAANQPVAADPNRGPMDVNPLLGRVRVFGQPVGGTAGRSALAIFFLMHYGIFWFVHGVFIFLLPSFFGGDLLQPRCGGLLPQFDPGAVGTPDYTSVCGSPFGDIVWSNVILGAVVLFVSHGASFLFNYIGRGEYLTTTPMRQMAAPYARVVVLHVTIIFGAFAIVFVGAPIGALLILVALKIAVDLALHLRERRGAAPPLA
ncbi:MAG TPA: DUF6498-containing protein, partial [Candidatus Limnocylindrales bacterium]|nr:DUF6498-containing protein [Candidatus Limnocylindrales bacterium]